MYIVINGIKYQPEDLVKTKSFTLKWKLNNFSNPTIYDKLFKSPKSRNEVLYVDVISSDVMHIEKTTEPLIIPIIIRKNEFIFKLRSNKIINIDQCNINAWILNGVLIHKVLTNP